MALRAPTINAKTGTVTFAISPRELALLLKAQRDGRRVVWSYSFRIQR